MPLSWGGASADPMPSPYKGWAKGQEEKIKDNYALRENSEKSWNWLIEPIPGLNRHLYCQRQDNTLLRKLCQHFFKKSFLGAAMGVAVQTGARRFSTRSTVCLASGAFPPEASVCFTYLDQPSASSSRSRFFRCVPASGIRGCRPRCGAS